MNVDSVHITDDNFVAIMDVMRLAGLQDSTWHIWNECKPCLMKHSTNIWKTHQFREQGQGSWATTVVNTNGLVQLLRHLPGDAGHSFAKDGGAQILRRMGASEEMVALASSAEDRHEIDLEKTTFIAFSDLLPRVSKRKLTSSEWQNASNSVAKAFQAKYPEIRTIQKVYGNEKRTRSHLAYPKEFLPFLLSFLRSYLEEYDSMDKTLG